MLRVRAAAAAVAVTAVLAACGGGGHAPATNPPAQVYAKRSTVPDSTPRVTPADYRRPIAAYKRYVRRQLTAMLSDVAALHASGDVAGARAAWLRVNARYESIGAAYGAFATWTRRSATTSAAPSRRCGRGTRPARRRARRPRLPATSHACARRSRA
jgi:hypothetical protein